MTDKLPTATLDAILDATRTVLAKELANVEPSFRAAVQAGVDMALKSVRLCATETLGPDVLVFGGTQAEIVEKIGSAWERNASDS